MSRLAAFLEDAGRMHREGGCRTLLKFVKSKVYETTDNLFYELPWTGVAPELPSGWHVTIVRSRDDAAGMALLHRMGSEHDLRFFCHKAVAYVLCIGDEPVARSWHFPDTPLARRFGPRTTYFGSMFVRPEWRGQGIQGTLNSYMSASQPAGTRALMEIVPTNVASHRGVLRGGAVLLGRLRMTVICGRIVWTRITPVSGDAGRPS